MPALSHPKEPLDLSHQYAPPAVQNYSICELEDEDASMALHALLADRFLPTPKDDKGAATRRVHSIRATEAFACDDFRMYEYKVRRCLRGRSHDWTDCPFTHPGEKVRRRDPRKFHYSGSPCPEFRKGSCRRGDACEFAHGVFECWLHPARYRTQACKDGKGCMRRVCFFAHTCQQLRHVAGPVEDWLADRAFNMVDACTHELGLPSHMISLEDGSSVVVSEASSPFDTDVMEGLDSQNVYANVGDLCEARSMLTLPSQNEGSSPEAVSGFSSNSPVGCTSTMVSMVHLPSLKIPRIAQRPSSAFSMMGMTAAISPTLNSQLYTAYLGGLSYPKSHDTLRSPLQQVAVLNTFLMSGGYDGRGESPLSASEEEFSDMVHHGGYAGDAAMQEGYLDGLGYGNHEVNEIPQMSLSTQFAAFGKEIYEFSRYNGSGSYGLPSPVSILAGGTASGNKMYEFSSYNDSGSYGLPSPISTLAWLSCSSPPSSPPLSPLSTANNEATNVFFPRGCNDLLGDSASWKGDVFIQNKYHVEEIGIKPTFADQRSPHAYHQSRLSACGKVNKLLPLHLKSPPFTQWEAGQYKWSPLCNNRDSNDTDKCDILQHTFSDEQYNNCGEFRGESAVEHAMPADLGWVNELLM